MSITYRLSEWGRWCRDHRGIGPRFPGCASIERQYRSPQCWESPKPTLPEPIDCAAMQVERAVRRLEQGERKVLRLRYAILPRRHGEPIDSYAERLRRAARLPAWALEDLLSRGVEKLARDICPEDLRSR